MQEDLVGNFGCHINKLAVINNPVDVETINGQAQKGERVFTNGVFNILAAGKLKYQKGFDLLIQSMSHIRRNNWHLTILGEGVEEKKLKQRAKKLNLSSKVTFAGFVDNPYKYMAQADLFVLSSRFEGFPNVVLEAMACGKPVVAFDCPGGISEIIKDGINGWKVEPGNITAFASTVERALSARWDEDLIKKGVETKCGVEKIVAEYEKIFSDVLNEERSKGL